ncbi:MAG: oxidoreductase [Lentisphaerae bacterium]|nr:oxidoreductase [Lentisphaerota bacterium]
MQLVKDPDNIKIGIIGMTEGNGHPYSWSAMFNKYDQKAMTAECPFPVIPVYLNKEDYDTMGITGAKIEVIYCNDRKDAEHVAKCSLIPNIVDRPEDMIGLVDAVIIATDIGSEHVERAKPFIEAGIPIFIDKPLCDNHKDLEFFKNARAGGAKIISSSSMRYCKEFAPYLNGHFHEIGQPRLITYSMPKKWETYGIHALEAVYALTGPGFVSIRNTGSERRNIVHLKHKNGFDVIISNIYDCSGAPLTIQGNSGTVSISIKDSYYAFRTQLVKFVEYLRTGIEPVPFAHTEELMKLVIGGIESREQGGKEILI